MERHLYQQTSIVRRLPFRCLIYIAIATLGVANSPCLSAQNAERGGVDWIFLLDTSKSMRGVGGTRNIFERVKEALKNFIDRTREGDSVTVYTFDTDTELVKNTRISGNIDKRELIKAVDRIYPNGNWTHTGKALHDALERTNELKSRSDASSRTVGIVLFTDGLEDTRGIPERNRVSIPSGLSIVPQDQPYIFVVSLGSEHDQKLKDFVSDPRLGGRGKILEDTGAEKIEEVSEGIRVIVEKPAPPKEVTLKLVPESLEFGEIDRSESTALRTFKCSSVVATRVRVSLDDSSTGIKLVEPTEGTDVPEGTNADIKVRLAAGSDTADGMRNLRLSVTPETAPPNVKILPTSLGAHLSVVHVPVWLRLLKWLLKWLAIILLLLIVTTILYSLYKGQMPNSLWRNFVERKFLEGELELIRPRSTQYVDGMIALGPLRSERVRLGSLLPEGAAGASDAELVTIRKNGNKLVQLRTLEGQVTVNKAGVAALDLYNGDIIDVGAARLQFNSVYERPPDNSDEDLGARRV